tara:strand:- start:315 stop:437 length:123 start_codon:yes stop_codon:yes gene_type:complete
MKRKFTNLKTVKKKNKLFNTEIEEIRDEDDNAYILVDKNI